MTCEQRVTDTLKGPSARESITQLLKEIVDRFTTIFTRVLRYPSSFELR